MAPTTTSTLAAPFWIPAEVASVSRLAVRASVDQAQATPAWPAACSSAKRRHTSPGTDVPGQSHAYDPVLKTKPSAGFMLSDPQEAPWHWPAGKLEHGAASTSAGGGFVGGSTDARVPQAGDAVSAADNDVVELTFKNDLYHTYRPSGRGSSVVTTSEPDTSRVPDINSAGHAALATSSTPDLQRALQGIRAQHKQQRADSSGGRLDPLSIPEDVQTGANSFAPVPQQRTLPRQPSGGVNHGSFIDSAIAFARAAAAPDPSQKKRRGDGGAKRPASPAQHAAEAPSPGKSAHAEESAPLSSRSSSGLSRWASSLSIGTGIRRDSKKAQQQQQQHLQQQHQHQKQQEQQQTQQQQQQQSGPDSPPPGSIASQGSQRSGSMITGFFSRFGKSVAAAPASFLVPALSSSPSTGRSPVASSAPGSSPQQPSTPITSASPFTEDDVHLKPLRRSMSEPLRARTAAVEADAARLLALEESMPAMDIDTADVASGSRQSREKIRRSGVRMRTDMRADIHSEPPPDRDHRRRRAFELEDVEDEFVNSELAHRSSIFNEGLRQVPSTSRPRQANAQRGSEWA